MADISFSDLAAEWAADKELKDVGLAWLDSSGHPNPLAVRKAIRSFNAKMRAPIRVFEVFGYMGLKRKLLVLQTIDVPRLKRFILKPEKVVEYRIIQEVEL